MAEIYNIDFETGDFSEFTADSTGGAQLTVSAVSPIAGSYSANHAWAAGIQNVSNSTSIGATSYLRCGFKIRCNSVGFGTTQTSFQIFSHNDGSTLYGFRFDKSGSEIHPALAGLVTITTSVDISDGDIHTIEARIVRDDANDGSGIHQIYVDGSLAGEDTNVSNQALFDDALSGVQNWIVNQLRVLSGSGHSGSITTDDWGLRDDDTPIYPGTPTAGEYTAAAIPRPVDIDADGDYLYIACLDSLGQPVLIQYSTALNADGSIVFQPGSGDNIGVECSRVDATEITVAGQFDGANVIERSSDTGASFSVIDDGTIGGIGAFKVGPDSDDRILVFDEDNSDLLETTDAGSNWTSINASVSEAIKVIGRLGIDVQQVIFGNSSADAKTVTHSMSTGADLESLSGGDDPNSVDVTSLIVN